MAVQYTPEDIVRARLAKEKEAREEEAARYETECQKRAEQKEQARLARLEETERALKEALPILLRSGLQKARLLRIRTGAHSEQRTKLVKHWWGTRERLYSIEVDDFIEVAAWEVRDNHDGNVYWFGRDGVLYRSRYNFHVGRYSMDRKDVLDAEVAPLHEWEGCRRQVRINIDNVRDCVRRNT